jgi:hypothetical protein
MTFDLFEASAPTAVSARAPARQPNPDAARYVMQPVPGELNRWTYSGETIVFDSRRAVGSKLGRWRTVEGIDKPVLQSDDRIEVCRAIDARNDAKGRP